MAARDGGTEIADRIRRKLTEALVPRRLDIVDETSLHAGHAGVHPQGESHFRIVIVADAFTGTSRVARHRLVYDLLAEEMYDRIHALALTTLTPSEESSTRVGG
ncbi:MAG: BolA family transcriptional regulator [Alphaproteobacteria bacterium]